METLRFYKLDKINYPGFRDRLIDLYMHAFTTGRYAQFITPEAVSDTFDGILSEGTVNMAVVEDRPVGMIAAFPLKEEPDFPAGECPDIPVGQALYIAEVMVHADYRGRGVASQMLESQLQEASKFYSHVVIRVWEENKPALELYRKLGFVPVAGISQMKRKSDGGLFEMKKVYLYKILKI